MINWAYVENVYSTSPFWFGRDVDGTVEYSVIKVADNYFARVSGKRPTIKGGYITSDFALRGFASDPTTIFRSADDAKEVCERYHRLVVLM